jgi:hypothetical protein
MVGVSVKCLLISEPNTRRGRELMIAQPRLSAGEYHSPRNAAVRLVYYDVRVSAC